MKYLGHYLESELIRLKDENYQKAIRLMEATRRMDLSQQYREAVEVEQQKSFEKKEGIKHDSGKPRMELLPFEVLEEVASVLTFGARKYSSWNWFEGFDYGRLQGAALRHLSSFQQGQDNDEESGISHLSHALCCILFLRALQMHGRGTDDRCKRKE